MTMLPSQYDVRRSSAQGRGARRRGVQTRAERPTTEALESRQLLSRDVPIRSIDGTGNNPIDPMLGSAGVDLVRISPAVYDDGVWDPPGDDRPSPRVISNAIHDQTGSALSQRGLSRPGDNSSTTTSVSALNWRTRPSRSRSLKAIRISISFRPVV